MANCLYSITVDAAISIQCMQWTSRRIDRQYSDSKESAIHKNVWCWAVKISLAISINIRYKNELAHLTYKTQSYTDLVSFNTSKTWLAWRGLCPLPQFFFHSNLEMVSFRCILRGILYSSAARFTYENCCFRAFRTCCCVHCMHADSKRHKN